MKYRFFPVLIITAIICLIPATGAAAEPMRISVLYFSNTGSDEDLSWLEKGIADMLLTDLALSDEIKCIEREQLEKVLNEQRFSLSGMADEKQSIEIGKILTAELLLTGSFIRAGDRLRIDGKLLDTGTGEVRAAVKTEGSIDTVFDMETEIVRGVFGKLGIELPAGIENSKSASVPAARAYYTGLDLFDIGEYSRAVEFYRQASIEDPEYGKPRAGLEESYRFLKDFKRMRYQREINTLLSKADSLRRRLKREPWQTYSDFLIQAYKAGETDNEKLNKKAEELGLFAGETPATCAWNLQTTLYEIADLAVEYFDDHELAGYSRSEIANIARQARISWPGDAFLPELIYQELLVTYFQNRWEESLVLCEELMINYPAYRMMWAVEDFYEESLSQMEDPGQQ